MPDLTFPPLLDAVQPFLIGQPVYLVGGAVRDALLGRASDDLDFVLAGGAIKLTFQVANALGLPAYVLDRQRDIGRVVAGETTLDFARFRATSLEEDLRDRDFTINAIALPASDPALDNLIDPTNGLTDLRARLIRPAHPGALAADPVRTLRALRLALSLDFGLAKETVAAIRDAAARLDAVSPERVQDELVKLLATRRPDLALAGLWELDLLAVIFPQLADLGDVAQSPPHYEPVLAHTISALRWLARVEAALDEDVAAAAELSQVAGRLAPFRAQLAAHLSRPVSGGLTGAVLLRLGALFHDAGKAETQSTEADRIRFLGNETAGAAIATQALRAYHFSNEAIEHVTRTVAGHMRPLTLAAAGPVTPRAAHRFFRDLGPAGLDIGLLSLADHLATYQGPSDDWMQLLTVVGELFAVYFDHYTQVVAPTPILNGREIMDALNLEPGPAIGHLLTQLVEAQAAGEVRTREEALAFIGR